MSRKGTNNNCLGQEERSVVWITPVSNADIYVDYNNTGDINQYVKFPTQQLSSVKFSDKVDSDMSGAVIFATQNGTGVYGIPVDIAAAWGQNSEVSKLVSCHRAWESVLLLAKYNESHWSLATLLHAESRDINGYGTKHFMVYAVSPEQSSPETI